MVLSVVSARMWGSFAPQGRSGDPNGEKATIAIFWLAQNCLRASLLKRGLDSTCSTAGRILAMSKIFLICFEL